MLFWIPLGAIILLLLWAAVIYNRLVSLRNEVKNAWKQIDVQLKRRHDLIPNLVSVVKGYMGFERDTLERVTAARTRAMSAGGIHERAAAESSLTAAIDRLYVVMENYPVLKSNENVMQLQEELTTTENRISFSRQFYNDLVANLATAIETFPNNIISSAFSFRKAEYFSAAEVDRELPVADIHSRAR